MITYVLLQAGCFCWGYLLGYFCGFPLETPPARGAAQVLLQARIVSSPNYLRMFTAAVYYNLRTESCDTDDGA